jgi:uncharacterized membrane protein
MLHTRLRPLLRRSALGAWLLAVTALLASAPALATSWFLPLPVLAGTPTNATVNTGGLSDDGTVAAGSNTQAVRWSIASDGSSASVQGLGALAAGSSSGLGISPDGSALVGQTRDDPSIATTQAFHWTQAGGLDGLGHLPGAATGEAQDASSNGAVVVGFDNVFVAGEDELYTTAFRWTDAEGMVSLGVLPGYDISLAYGVSGDGSKIVGSVETFFGGGSQAFLWTQATGMVGLGSLQGTQSEAAAISTDGSTVVGNGDQLAWVWTEADGMLELEDPLGGHADALAVSGNGLVIGGRSVTQGAFIWDSNRQLVSLEELLAANGLGLPAGWTLLSVTELSYDGKTMAGLGRDANDAVRPWVAHFDVVVPEPGTLLLLGGGLVALAATRPRDA